MRDVGENGVLGSPPNPHYDHQGDNRHDNPEYPLQRTNNRRSLIRWIREIRVLYKNTISLLHNDRVSLDFHLRPLHRDCIAIPTTTPVRHHTPKNSIPSCSQLHRHRRHLLHRIHHHHPLIHTAIPCLVCCDSVATLTRHLPADAATAHAQGNHPCEGSH